MYIYSKKHSTMANKQKEFNPFSMVSYLGSDYFCDRENEAKQLKEALENGRNVTLISPRRMGKTGLIKHVFAQISPKEAYCHYIDLDSTTTFAEFVKAFGEVVLKQSGLASKRVWKEIQAWFKSLRPVLTSDPIGFPKLSLDVQPTEAETTLGELFAWLEQSDRPCYVAFDEFQVIADYPEKKTEAMLRSHIQHLTNVRFIFAGSQKHLMTQMFMAASRPFFQSTQMFPLYEIAEAPYFDFAKRHFERHGQTIPEATFHELYTMLYSHTWYIQCVLNRLYQYGTKNIDRQAMLIAIDNILTEYKETFRMYCNLITSNQLDVIKAIAKEGKVKEVNGRDFLEKHQPGAPSTVRNAVNVLIEKELLIEDEDGYSVYDRFFGLWLRR